jgi:hypothetical protein
LHRYLYAYSSPMTYVDLWGEDIDPFYNTKHQLETMGITRPAPVENVGPFVIRARVNDKGEVIGYVAASDRTGQWMDYYLLDSTTDLAKFKRNIKSYGSSTFMNAAEETQREPEWAREYGYSAYMAMKGHGGEAFKSLGRQWISALKDPLWWMVAGPATLAPFVGPASESGAVVDGEGGEVRPVANPRGKAPASPDVSTEGQAPQSPGNSPRVARGTGLDSASQSGADARPDPGSVEHKAARWEAYKARGGKWDYEHWSNIYERNMLRASRANQAADAFHEKLGWGRREVTVDVEGVPRRLDIADPATQKGWEIKTGRQYATQENLWEVQRDQILREEGWDIRWHFEGRASKPLIKALNEAGIPHTGGEE